MAACREAAKMDKSETVLVNMSGRGDKDIFTVADVLINEASSPHPTLQWEGTFLQLTVRTSQIRSDGITGKSTLQRCY